MLPYAPVQPHWHSKSKHKKLALVLSSPFEPIAFTTNAIIQRNKLEQILNKFCSSAHVLGYYKQL